TTNYTGNTVWIKRNVVPSEWQTNRFGDTIIPLMPSERLKNELKAMDFIRRHTDIPLPSVRSAFEDNERFYVILDHAPGIELADLPEDKKATAIAEVEKYLATLRELKSSKMGALDGPTCLPHRLAIAFPREEQERGLAFRPDVPYELVFCHGDLSQHNVLVDEATLKVTAILDWEYAGFYPKEFEGLFYKRRGPSGAIGDEVSDVPMLLEMLKTCTISSGEGGELRKPTDSDGIE
ncbi:kinase-like domain-containing protein, partial [Amylostereum chailletii]